VRLPAELPIARQDFAEMAAVLEARMKDRQFVVGDQATVADFVMAYTLDWANEARLLGEFLNLAAYLERMYARPNAPPRIAQALASIAA
jgi:glutathione S-transferase